MKWKMILISRGLLWVLPGLLICIFSFDASAIYIYPFLMSGPFLNFELAFFLSPSNLTNSLLFTLPAVIVIGVDIWLLISKQYEKNSKLNCILVAYLPASSLWHYLGVLLAGASV